MVDFRIENGTVRFWLKVKPRSSRERLTLGADGEMKLELHAAPAGGEANEACVEFFSRALRIPKNSVTILSGHKSRRKWLAVSAGSGAQTAERLRALVRQGSGKRQE